MKQNYESCYAQVAETIDLQTFKAMCAELDRTGGAAGVTASKGLQPMVAACQDPEAMVQFMAAAAVSGKSGVGPPAWTVQRTGAPGLAGAMHTGSGVPDSGSGVDTNRRTSRRGRVRRHPVASARLPSASASADDRTSGTGDEL